MAKLSELSDEIQALFLRRSSTRIKPGLERMRAGISRLQFASTRMPQAIIVGGTNGKGTTAGALWRMLAKAGLRAGLYTSPHLMEYSERIQCSHTEITTKRLLEELQHLHARLDAELFASLSFFEVTTLIAALIFSGESCDVMVLEVGLGGKYDATNAFDPCASCIASIDMDHTEWLGPSLYDIAIQKLGIARADRPLFWGDPLSSSKFFAIRERLSLAVKATGAEIHAAGIHFGLLSDTRAFVVDRIEGQRVFDLPEALCKRPRPIVNAFVLAHAVAYVFLGSHYPNLLGNLDPNNFYAKSPPWPFSWVGRFQRLDLSKRGGPQELIVDVCHNPAAVREFIETLRDHGYFTQETKLPVVFAGLKDKDTASILSLLREVFSPIMVFKLDTPRACCVEDLVEHHEGLEIYEDFASVLAKRFPTFDRPLIVCGSFFAVGSVFEFFNLQIDSLLSSIAVGHDPDPDLRK